MQLIEHIEIILSDYPCVSIPGFGGFVVQDVDSRFVGGILYPPSIEVTFNRELSHNDGLLVTHLVRIKGFSAVEANSWIKQEVSQLQKSLMISQELELGRLGRLTVNNEGGLVFDGSKNCRLFSTYVGMTPVLLQPIASLSFVPKPAAEESSVPLVLPMPRIESSYFKYVASIAAVLLFFFISTPPLHDSRSTQTASMLFDSFKLGSKLVLDIDTCSIPETIESEPFPSIQEEENMPVTEFVSEGRYSVVVLSCVSKASAEVEMAKRKSILDTAKIVEGSGRYRVIVMQTNSRKKANQCLMHYVEKGLTDTWMHISK